MVVSIVTSLGPIFICEGVGSASAEISVMGGHPVDLGVPWLCETQPWS